MREEKKAAPAAVAGPDRQALIDVIAQGLSDTWHCLRVWEAWNVGTMSQDDFEPVDESDTPAELADAILALLAAAPTTQAAPQREVFDEDGFRAWVIRNLPDNTIIGNSAWWADHLAAWVQRFMLAAPQPSPVAQGDAEDAARWRFVTDLDNQEFAVCQWSEIEREWLLVAHPGDIDIAMAKKGGAA